MTPRAERHTVTLLERADCAACEQAAQDLQRICGELGVAWQRVNVDSEDELRAEYGDRIPVILLDDTEHGFWNVEEHRLRAALAD